MEIYEVIKNIRKELNISQTEFAHAVHVSFSTVNRWENDRVKPNRLAKVTIIEYCKKQNVSKSLIDSLQDFE